MQASNTPPPESPAQLATRREWLGLAIIALPCMVYAMDSWHRYGMYAAGGDAARQKVALNSLIF